MYTSGRIANSHRMSTEINESGAIAKIRFSVESDTVERLISFRIISSKIPISHLKLIIFWLSAYSDILLSFELKMVFQIIVSKGCITVSKVCFHTLLFLKNNSV